MREILFRGKTEDNKWEYGYPYETYRNCHTRKVIAQPPNAFGCGKYTEVISRTVGQFTGITDKNGVKIFEHDIIQVPDDFDVYGYNAGEIYEVYFAYGGFRLKPKYNKKARGYWLEDDLELHIIGNIHDNPELLEGGVENG